MSGYMHLQGKAASDYLREKKRKKSAKVSQTKTIQLGFYQEGENIGRVMTGVEIGTHELAKQADGAYIGEGEFYGKKYPIVAEILAVGTIPKYRWHQYDTEELDPVQPVVNFLPWLEDYRQERLTPEEQAKLSAMTLADTHDAEGKVVKGLHSIQKDFFEANLGNWTANWTPWIDAVNSIMQDDNGMTDGFPKRKYIVVPHYQDEDGRKVIGADVTLYVNGAKFVAGEGGVSYCNGAVYKYFTWEMAVGVLPDGELHYPPKSPNEADE